MTTVFVNYSHKCLEAHVGMNFSKAAAQPHFYSRNSMELSWFVVTACFEEYVVKMKTFKNIKRENRKSFTSISSVVLKY
jgi:hypothetical protein